MPSAEPLALVAYRSKTKFNRSLRLIAPVLVPLKRVAPEFHDPPTYTRALRDSLLLSPPSFSSRRKPATGDLARHRGFKGSAINTTSVKTPLISQLVTTPNQSVALRQTISLLPSQESARSTFSAVVDRVRASTNSRSVRLSSARREAKRVPPSVQETYDEADPFSTNGDSFYAPSFVHSSDINNIESYMTSESSKSRKVTEPKLRRKNSRHDLRTEEVKIYKMKTTLYDMSIYGVPTLDNSKPRTKRNPSSKSSTHTEQSPSLETLPRPTCTSRPESGNDFLSLCHTYSLQIYVQSYPLYPQFSYHLSMRRPSLVKIIYRKKQQALTIFIQNLLFLSLTTHLRRICASHFLSACPLGTCTTLMFTHPPNHIGARPISGPFP